jgi:hypothetical protein
MFHLVLPEFAPKTLEELHSEPDEVSSLVYLEDAIAKEVSSATFGGHRVVRSVCRVVGQTTCDHLLCCDDPTSNPPQLVTIREYNKDAAPLGHLPEREEEQQSEEDVAGGSASGDSGA